MLVAILLILIVFWFLGYGPLTVFHFRLFQFNGHIITVWDVLIFLLVIWLVDLLPAPFRQIAVVVLIIWLLATLGVIAIPALSSLLIIATVLGLLLYIISGR